MPEKTVFILRCGPTSGSKIGNPCEILLELKHRKISFGHNINLSQSTENVCTKLGGMLWGNVMTEEVMAEHDFTRC